MKRAPDGDIRLSQASFQKVSAVSQGDMKGHCCHLETFNFCSLEPTVSYIHIFLCKHDRKNMHQCIN